MQMKKVWKKHSILLLRILNVSFAVTACVGYHTVTSARVENIKTIEEQQQEENMDVSMQQADLEATDSLWKDGSYVGTGIGFGGEIQVEVTIMGGKITEVTLLQAKKEDAAYLENAKKLLTDIVQQQDAEVDIASGATYSSNGIKEATSQALSEARR